MYRDRRRLPPRTLSYYTNHALPSSPSLPSVQRKNCNHFSDELAIRLLGARIPGWVNRLSYVGQKLSCIIPESVWTGGAPVNGSGGGGGEGDDDDDEGKGSGGGGGSSFQVFAPRGARNSGSSSSSSSSSSTRASAGASKPVNSGVAPGGTGYTLGSAAGSTTTTTSVSSAGPGRPGAASTAGSSASAHNSNREALRSAAMKRLQQQEGGADETVDLSRDSSALLSRPQG